MRLKWINAVLSLLTALALLLHMGYTVYAYLTFSYHPVLKLVMTIPFLVLTCLHAFCGMAAVFLKSDGARLDLYPKQNLRTVLQRVSAALILPLLILHMNTFSLLGACAECGIWFCFYLLMFSQALFFGTVLTHTAVSLTRALITLGRLSSREKQRNIDRIVYVICAAVFAAAVIAVFRAEMAMFVAAKGA